MATYTFNDVLIQPNYSEIRSRKSVDISSSLGELNLDIPVISANMKTVTGPRMTLEMGERGAWGILHRFNTIEGAVEDYNLAKSQMPGVSIGVNGDYKERFEALYNAGARYFCIDIAHGHSIMMKETLEYIKSEQSDIYVMAGNVATPKGATDLADWGANAVKVGIGPGSMCQTRTNTGVGVPQLWALEQIASKRSMVPGIVNRSLDSVEIIADGGIKTVGDIAKALKYADHVMLGSFFAGCHETPGDVYKRKNGSRYKVYGGSAAANNKTTDNGRKPEFVEGVTEEVDLNDHVKFLLKEIKEGVQSAFSYVGANNLKEYQKKCEFIHLSGGGKDESKF